MSMVGYTGDKGSANWDYEQIKLKTILRQSNYERYRCILLFFVNDPCRTLPTYINNYYYWNKYL